MANERYTRTNQKIFFAGLALDSWRRAEDAGSLQAPGKVQAEREASLFHLHGAVLGLCHEIAGYYRLPISDAPRIEDILTRANLEASPTPELAELLELAENADTWLAQLLAQHAMLFQPPHAPAKARAEPGVNVIETVSLGDERPALLCAEVESWRQELKRLILRFRQGMTEW